MNKIKVLHVYKTCHKYSKGGMEEVLQQLCLATNTLSVQNRIICLNKECKKKEINIIDGTEIICYPQNFEIASCGFSWQLWWDFKQHMQWASIVHYQFPWPFADILSLTHKKIKPYVISYQSDIVRQKGLKFIYQPLMNYFLRHADAVVGTSPDYIESSVVLNKFKNKTIMIANGMAPISGDLNYQQELEQYQQEFPDDFFLFIGVFRYYKGIQYLLEAARKNKYPILIVGDGKDAEIFKDYKNQYNLQHVYFLGQVNEVQKYALIELAKALILPASERSEAYGMVLVEAARQGTPMISTELGSGTSYINKHKQTGWVIPAKDSEALATAMKFFNDNQEVVVSMGVAAEHHYQKEFTVAKMAKEYRALYCKILDCSES